MTKVLRNAVKWSGFNCEKMGKGAAILWNKENVKRRSVLAEQKVGTEASYPTVLTSRKRKRNPEEWKKNLRKKAVNKTRHQTSSLVLQHFSVTC